MKNESKQNKNELKASDSKTYRLKTEEGTKNDEERMKNSKGLPQNRSRKHLGSITEAPRLGFFFFFLFSSLISSESLVQKLLDP